MTIPKIYSLSNSERAGVEYAFEDSKAKFLVEGSPVARIDGSYFSTSTRRELIDAIYNFFIDTWPENIRDEQGDKESRKTVLFNSPFGNVRIDYKGVKDSIAHSKQSDIKSIESYKAVKAVLNHGCIILPLGNYRSDKDYIAAKNRRKVRGKANRTGIIAAPILIDDERYICAIGIMEHNDMSNNPFNRLYMQEACIIEKIQEKLSVGDPVRSIENDSNSPTFLRFCAKILINFLYSKNSYLNKPKNDSIETKKDRLSKWNTRVERNYYKNYLIGDSFCKTYYNDKISNYNNINTMANKTKKALYESIMKDVAKVVKRKLNEVTELPPANEANEKIKNALYNDKLPIFALLKGDDNYIRACVSLDDVEKLLFMNISDSAWEDSAFCDKWADLYNNDLYGQDYIVSLVDSFNAYMDDNMYEPNEYVYFNKPILYSEYRAIMQLFGQIQ